MKTVNDIKLSDFAQMVRMSAEGKFKTSIEKTTGGIYVDSDGNVKNVRHAISKTKGDAEQNLLLRQKLVDAFVRGHATQQFLNVVRQKLGLKADNTAANESASKALGRRDVKALLGAFAEGRYKVRIKGHANARPVRESHSFAFKSETKKIGQSEWVEIADPKFEAKQQKLVNGLSERIMSVFKKKPTKMFTFYKQMVKQSGLEGVNMDHPPTSKAEIKKLVAKIVAKNWHSSPVLKAILTGTMKKGAVADINRLMQDHLYATKGHQNKDEHKASGLAYEFLRVGNGAELGESSIRDILTVNGVKYDHGNITPEQEAELEKAFEKPDEKGNMLGTPWERDGALLPLSHALVTLLPPDLADREKFLLFATSLMGYNGPSSIGVNPEFSGKDNGYGKLDDIAGKKPVNVGDNGGVPQRMDLRLENDESGNPKSLVLTQAYGIGPALTNFFGCDLDIDGWHYCVEMGRFETTVTIDLTQGLDENGKPHFTTHTVRLPDAAAPEVENAKVE